MSDKTSIGPAGRAFCARLEGLRTARQLTQDEFADLIGASQSTINPWLNGTGLPSAEALLALPEALGVNGHWLLTGVKPVEPPDSSKADDSIPRATAVAAALLAKREIAAALDQLRKNLAPTSIATNGKVERAKRMETRGVDARKGRGKGPVDEPPSEAEGGR